MGEVSFVIGGGGFRFLFLYTKKWRSENSKQNQESIEFIQNWLFRKVTEIQRLLLHSSFSFSQIFLFFLRQTERSERCAKSHNHIRKFFFVMEALSLLLNAMNRFLTYSHGFHKVKFLALVFNKGQQATD